MNCQLRRRYLNHNCVVAFVYLPHPQFDILAIREQGLSKMKTRMFSDWFRGYGFNESRQLNTLET
jgi:hypothetical protein